MHMLSPAEKRRTLSKPCRRHSRIPNVWFSPWYSTESTTFPVVLRADVESPAFWEEGIGEGAAIHRNF